MLLIYSFTDETLFTASIRDSDTECTVRAPIPKLPYSFPRICRKDTVPVRGKTILTIPAATSDKKIVFCKQHIPRTCAKVHVSPVSSLLPSFPVPINVSTVVILGSKVLTFLSTMSVKTMTLP